MSEKNHPINDLMSTTMQKIREMVDANTIVGQPISTPEGVTLIPVSKLSFGFASGGSDYVSKNHKPGETNTFGGGSGAGVKVAPVAFLIIKGDSVRVLPVDSNGVSSLDRAIDTVPEVLDKIIKFLENLKKDKESF